MSREHLDIVSRWEHVGEGEEAVVVEQRPKVTNWMEWSIISLAVGLLIGMPLFFGGKQIWALSVAKTTIWICCAFVAIDQAFKLGGSNRTNLNLSYGALGRLFIGASVLTLSLVFIQVLPIPVSFLAFISPRTADLYRLTGSFFGSISLETISTLSDGVWLSTLLVFGAVLMALPFRPIRTALSLHRKRARQHNSTLERARNMDSAANIFQLAVVVSGVLLSLIAIGHWVFGSTLLFGVFEPAVGEVNPTRAHWPFVNPDHLSFVLQISLLTATSRFLRLIQLITLRRGREEAVDFGLRLLRSPEKFGKQMAYAGVIFFIAVGNFLTLSRAGIGLMVLGLGLLWIVFRKFPIRIRLRSVPRKDRLHSRSLALKFANQLHRFRGPLIAGLLVFGVIVFVGQTGRDLAAQRLEYGLTAGSERMRYEFLKSTIAVMGQYPLLGVGLGCWKFAAAAIIPQDLAGWRLDYAHDDITQFLSEAGIAGLLLVVWFLNGVVTGWRKAWHRSLLPSERFQISAAAITVGVPLLHAFVDFPLHIPGAAFTLLLSLVVFFRLLESSREKNADISADKL